MQSSQKIAEALAKYEGIKTDIFDIKNKHLPQLRQTIMELRLQMQKLELSQTGANKMPDELEEFKKRINDLEMKANRMEETLARQDEANKTFSRRVWALLLSVLTPALLALGYSLLRNYFTQSIPTPQQQTPAAVSP